MYDGERERSNKKPLTHMISFEMTMRNGREIPSLILPQSEEDEQNEELEELKVLILQGKLEYRERYAGLGTVVYEVMFPGNQSSGVFIRQGEHETVSGLLYDCRSEFLQKTDPGEE